MRTEVERVSADKSDVLEDGVVVVISLTVGIYSVAEIEGAPGCKESVARRDVSDSDKVFVEVHEEHRQGEKKFELEMVVAEKKGFHLGVELTVPMIAR